MFLNSFKVLQVVDETGNREQEETGNVKTNESCSLAKKRLTPLSEIFEILGAKLLIDTCLT